METNSCNIQTDVKITVPSLVSLKKKQKTTIVKVNGVEVGGSKVLIIAGPCAVESMEQLFEINDQWAMNAEAFPAWGPYWCIHFTKGKGTMLHIAKDPSRDNADIILLVQAGPFIEKAGLNIDVFPQLDGPPPWGPGLTSGQWYYLPKFKLLVLPMSVEEVGMKNNLVPKI